MNERQRTDTFQADPQAAESTPLTAALTSTPGAAPEPADSPEPPLPRAFGRYELRRLLGRGGMGRVYLAHDPHLDRLVALKMPTPVAVAGWRERFLAEARAAATLTHPNVCPVHDVGELDGQPYLTMAFLEGETLAARLAREGPLEPAEAVELVGTVARAMHVAHRRGVVHRDLKPANLMIAPDGRPVVMDFGLAIRSTSADDLRLTLTGVALGTPAYMPPEQASGEHEDIGPPSDVYSLGVILFELVTGRVPFKAKSFGKLLAQIERDPPPAPSSLNPAVDDALEAVILTALAKAPADRFATAGELADALDRYQEGDHSAITARYRRPYVVPDATGEYLPDAAIASAVAPPKRSPRRWWLAGAAALLLAAAAGAVIYVQTDHGQLVVQLSDPDAKVDVRVNGQEVTLDPGGGKAVKVKAGANHKLEVTGADFESVAESFDVKRNGVTLARVTLVPKGKAGPVPPAGKSGDPPGKEPPKPPYPDKPTLIETPGWQVYADATREQMKAWLADRKKAGHSVTWIDAYPVGDTPVFCAAAFPDDRAAEWDVLWDVPAPHLADLPTLRERIDTARHWPLAIAGYVHDGEPHTVSLWLPGVRQYGIAGGLSRESLTKVLDKFADDGVTPRVLRPYPVGPTTLWADYIELAPAARTGYELELDGRGLADFLDRERKADRRPFTVAGYLRAGGPAYAVVSGPNPGKWDWKVETDLTAADLKARAAGMAAGGFRPLTVTALGHGGTVRYCVVWVKEPPRPTPYPEAPTLVEAGGWQTLTDATQDQMQQWLDERKKAKHSVMWLDAYAVGDRPVYSAVAALDDRQPDWTAALALPIDMLNMQKLNGLVNVKKNRVVAYSGYFQGAEPYAVVLFHPGEILWMIGNPRSPLQVTGAIEDGTKTGGHVPVLRAYPANNSFFYVMTLELNARGGKPIHKYGMTADDLDAYLNEQRANGYRPSSVSAVPHNQQLLFAAVMVPDPAKATWEVHRDLTAETLKAKAAEMVGRGFTPTCLTGYPWDGKTRYIGVWVKEPPRPFKYPNKPTLIETAGWQVLTDATKEQADIWLDERKKAGHSVMWLDAYPVGDKPVYTAVAALNDRQPKWVAITEASYREMMTGGMAKRVDFENYFLRAAGGYGRDGVAHFATLWHPGLGRWNYFIESPLTLPNMMRKVAENGSSLRIARAFPISPDAVRWLGFVEHNTDIPTECVVDLNPSKVAGHLEAERRNGRIPLGLSAAAVQGQLTFAVVTTKNTEKTEWHAEWGLTADRLAAAAKAQSAKGFRPDVVTAYAWDGAVRYCVVWVKEPAKTPELPVAPAPRPKP